MKRTLIASIVGMALVITAGTAVAQKRGKAEAGRPSAKSGYDKVKSFDFLGDTIDGELVNPNLERVGVVKPAEHGSLIRVRQGFILEIVKSGEDL